MMWKSLILILSITFSLSVGVWAQPQNQLISLFDFGTTVRATGMGGAFAGLADDAQAILYNPAGLGLLERLHANATAQSHLGQSSITGLMAAMPSLGLGIQLYDVGGLVQRNDNDDEGAAFSYGQFAFLGAGALRLGSLIGVPSLNGLSFGLRFKFLSVNTLAAGSGSTFALDPSMLWEIGDMNVAGLAVSGIRVGATIDNLGTGITYGSGYQESLAMSARIGVSVVVQSSTVVGLEFNTATGLHVGGEHQLPIRGAGTLSIRSGINTANGFTFNLGLGFLYQQLVRVDYAFASHGQLFGSHQLAVAVAYNIGRLF